jgi:hypothetical protein
MDALTEDARMALEPLLGRRERVRAVLAAVGCKLALTDRHLALVRDGRAFRPRSGVQVWPLDETLSIRCTPTASQPGRILITSGGHTTSVFVPADHHRDADLLVAEVRRRIHRSR